MLEYNRRAGGRSWTLRGGDEYTELGGFQQRCEFDAGHYINPGPWRIPYHHHGVLSYAHQLGVPLEPFVQVNHNAFLHSKNAYGGRPQRFRQVQADFNGEVAELLAKAVSQKQLDAGLTPEDQERLLAAMRQWGALDRSYRYVAGSASSERRGWDVDPAGGLMPAPAPSAPLALNDLLKSGLWQRLITGHEHEFQTTLFQPVGGMDRIVTALHAQVADAVQFGARVTAIAQDARGVTVTYSDTATSSTTRPHRARRAPTGACARSRCRC